jgi:F-type H+-transporting ATPase subunit delta
MASSVAEVYAESLFEIAFESGTLSETAREITEISVVLSGFPELSRLLTLPTITANEKCDIIKNVFSGRVSEVSEHFLMLLAVKKRINFFDKIATEFRKRYNKAQGELDITVTSPVPLSDEQLTALAAKMESKYKRKIKAHMSIDHTLMGGIVIEADGVTIDGSVKGKLQNMKQLITSVTA